MLHMPMPPPWHSHLTTVGVTGTDGKTSTVAMIARALARLANPVSRITSLGAFLNEQPFGDFRNYRNLVATMKTALELGGRYAVVEWASWSLANGFVASWPSQIAVLTNVTRDHIDYHGSAAAYVASKAKLFQALPVNGIAVVNVADRNAAAILEAVPRGTRIIRYGQCPAADVYLADTRTSASGTDLHVRVPPDLDLYFRVPMIGSHFAENATAALATAIAMGMKPEQAAHEIGTTPTPPGRFEIIAEKPLTVIDFAHTPNALARTLRTARALSEGKLIVVFGAGGERDVGKRELMGRAAAIADLIVLTSDNPRSENPLVIISQIRAGVPANSAVELEPDRTLAIRKALAEAADEDVVVIAGRGRDTHQLIGHNWIAMNDAEVVQAALRR